LAKNISKFWFMKNFKAATEKREIKIGNEVIVLDTVKGDSTLFRVMINNSFKGYLQNRDGEYFRVDGSCIHDLIFARICHSLKN